jgi:tol-pal system protein YbgF
MVAELGTAEPSPGFAVRVRERIEVPTWWQRVVHALFLPLQVKVPIQAVALAVVAFVGVMLYQKSPEMQAQRRLTVGQPSSARPAEPASRAGEISTPSRPPASPGPPVEGVFEDKRDGARQVGAAQPPALPEERAAPAQPPDQSATVASVPERDRPDPAMGKLDAAQPPPVAPPPARQLEQQESRAFEYADRQQPRAAPAPPPGTGAPAPPPLAQEAAKRRVEAPAREKTRELEKGLGKEVLPAETGAPKTPETRDERWLRRETESKDVGPPPAASPAPPPALQGLARPRDDLAVIPRGSASDLYSAGLTEYARQAYDRAIEAFRAFLAQFPQDARAPDARYWLANSYFHQRRYAEAIPEYEAVIRQFPESRRVPAATFRQGQARLALGDPAGCQDLREVVGRFPRTREAGQARETLAARCP